MLLAKWSKAIEFYLAPFATIHLNHKVINVGCIFFYYNNKRA
jgi:hypothetical protein